MMKSMLKPAKGANSRGCCRSGQLKHIPTTTTSVPPHTTLLQYDSPPTLPQPSLPVARHPTQPQDTPTLQHQHPTLRHNSSPASQLSHPHSEELASPLAFASLQVSERGQSCRYLRVTICNIQVVSKQFWQQLRGKPAMHNDNALRHT